MLLTFGGDRSEGYAVAHDVGLIPDKSQLPCRALVACLTLTPPLLHVPSAPSGLLPTAVAEPPPPLVNRQPPSIGSPSRRDWALKDPPVAPSNRKTSLLHGWPQDCVGRNTDVEHWVIRKPLALCYISHVWWWLAPSKLRCLRKLL